MYYIFYLLFFLIIFISPATGDINTISGNIVNNQNFTLNGSFNTKTSSAPIRWETSESYELGSNLTDASGWWTHRLGYEDCTISNDKSRGVSSKSIKAEILGGLAGSKTPNIWKNNIGFASTGKVYINMWIWWDWGDLWQTAIDPYQIKTIGLAPSISDEGSPVAGFGGSFYLWWHILSGGYPVTCMYHYFDDFGTQCWTNNTVANSGYWINVTIMYDQGHSGLNDGKFYGYVLDNGVYKANAGNGIGKDFWSGSEAPYTELMNAIKIFNYVDLNANESGRINLYYDDIYIDNSWSRVEVGNNPVYANCTHRELQPHLSWNNNQIVGNFNQGSFNVGDTVYFFVIDEENIPSPGVAAVIQEPSITVSNASINNNTLTISGYSFGTKSTAAPLKFDNFESGVTGSLLSTGGYWSHRPGNTASFFDITRGSSSKSARQQQIGDETEGWFYRNNIWSDDDDKGLVSFWCKTDVTGYDPVDTWQQKMWTVIYDGSQYEGYGGWNFPTIYTGPQYDKNTIYDYLTLFYNSDGVNQDPINGDDLYNTINKWQMTTLLWKRSSIDGQDAIVYRYLSDPNEVLSVNKLSKLNFNTRTTVNNRNIKSIQLGLFNTNSNENANVTMYYDDIYMDNSWSRVEIGDNPIYDNCKHREFQPIVSWNNNQVVTTLNRGSFNLGDTVYVFVVDNDNKPSPGKQIVLNNQSNNTVQLINTSFVGSLIQ